MYLSPEQLEILLQMPALIIGATMKSDNTGFFQGFREASAGAQFLDGAVERYKDNVVVLEVIASMEREHELPADLDVITYEEVFAQIDHINALLSGSPYAQGFNVFLYELAEAVANAAGAGFFGGGDKITEGEAEFLDALRQQLGLA